MMNGYVECPDTAPSWHNKQCLYVHAINRHHGITGLTELQTGMQILNSKKQIQ